MLDTKCPNCGAPHARKLSLIFHEGLSNSGSVQHSKSVTKTIVKMRIATTGHSSGSQQTNLSASAAPPLMFNKPLISKAQNSRKEGMIGIFIFSAFMGFSFSSSAIGFFGIFLGGGTVASMILWMLMSGEATHREKEEHEKSTATNNAAQEEWNRTFSCNSCGNRFIPIEVNNPI
jgi:predicted nucleic-acid-binding Zn-ribbon protein